MKILKWNPVLEHFVSSWNQKLSGNSVNNVPEQPRYWATGIEAELQTPPDYGSPTLDN